MTEVWARHAAADPARPLRVAVVTRARDALSLTHARDAIVRELAELGVAPIAVPARGGPPVGCDLLWDPALAGTRGPRHLCAAAAGLPVVVTAHGAAAWVLPWHEVWRSRAAALWGRLRRRRALQDWHRAMPRLDAVVGVSDFGRREIGRVFRVPPGRLHRIYPGVAAIPFRPEGPAIRVGRPYLLYVAQYRPKKNLETVLAAYAQVPRERRPELVAIVPGAPSIRAGLDGLRLVRETVTPAELAGWYRGARALVFPSLHETFGHPILEAMACGCPVITSSETACPEVAGDAALLVDPRSAAAIADAMRRLEAPAMRDALRERGLARARRFTWRETATRYRELFAALVRRAGPPSTPGGTPRPLDTAGPSGGRQAARSPHRR
ncbi:MAG TPA: glycosyltransferase family 1 protein [Methylomirabilota bacterium]|nr:glycosyltransferase family 1 protein [Methylomirabilota bacterium]